MACFVYRIQDKNGRGPYKPGFSQYWIEARAGREYLRSYIEEFGPVHLDLIIGESAGCGCKTLDQLRRWFTKTEYKRLKKYGYKAVRMEVGRIIAESDTQCVFGRAKPLREDIKPVKLY